MKDIAAGIVINKRFFLHFAKVYYSVTYSSVHNLHLKIHWLHTWCEFKSYKLMCLLAFNWLQIKIKFSKYMYKYMYKILFKIFFPSR